MKLYRFLSAPDDSSFCHKVTAALNKGWHLFGSPTYAYDKKTKIDALRPGRGEGYRRPGIRAGYQAQRLVGERSFRGSSRPMRSPLCLPASPRRRDQRSSFRQSSMLQN